MLDASWASACFERFGLWGIFLFNVLEYACLPMPSEVLLPLAGFAAATYMRADGVRNRCRRACGLADLLRAGRVWGTAAARAAAAAFSGRLRPTG